MVDPSYVDRKLAESPSPFSKGQWDHEIIPETRNNRTLVLCFDGTGDKFDSDVRKPTTSIILSFHHYHPHFRIMSELERRAVHITAQEGQQARTDGVLSGTSAGTPVWHGTDIVTKDRNRHICCQTRSGIFHPNFQEDVETVGRGRGLEPGQSHAVSVSVFLVSYLHIHESCCQLVTNS